MYNKQWNYIHEKTTDEDITIINSAYTTFLGYILEIKKIYKNDKVVELYLKIRTYDGNLSVSHHRLRTRHFSRAKHKAVTAFRIFNKEETKCLSLANQHKTKI